MQLLNYSVPAIFFFKVSMSVANSFLLSCCLYHTKKKNIHRNSDSNSNWSKLIEKFRTIIRLENPNFSVHELDKIRLIPMLINTDGCICMDDWFLSYLEEEVAVDEPAGVAEADELQDLGELQEKSTSANLSSVTVQTKLQVID